MRTEFNQTTGRREQDSTKRTLTRHEIRKAMSERKKAGVKDDLHINLNKLREIERELGLRRNVYPRWVAEGKISQEEAKRRIEIMEGIANDYREATEKEHRTLFSRRPDNGTK